MESPLAPDDIYTAWSDLQRRETNIQDLYTYDACLFLSSSFSRSRDRKV